MLFVFAGYGDYLCEQRLNGVWGEEKGEVKFPPTPSPLPQKERAAMAKGINTGSEYKAAMESAIKPSL